MKTRVKWLSLSLISLAGLMSLSGCTSMLSSQMPKGSVSMQQAYDNAISGGSSAVTADDSMHQVRNQVSALKQLKPSYIGYTRTQENEINSQFRQLPNPNVVMYIYPHQAGTGDNLTPVPGYSTVFPLYQHIYYSMPRKLSFN